MHSRKKRRSLVIKQHQTLIKIRYCAEKNNHNGSWHVPKRRARKHPLASRRPMSAFLRFSKSCRKKVRVDNPHVDNTDIS
eukprot:scaffold7470_cov127-Chaetoceros_neogracile.AAC.1